MRSIAAVFMMKTIYETIT